MTNHAKGLLMTAIGGLGADRRHPADPPGERRAWSILLLRTGTTFVAALVVWAVWRVASSPTRRKLVPGRKGLMVAALYGFGSICFITAVFNTRRPTSSSSSPSTTMFAALLSWVFLGERPANGTHDRHGCHDPRRPHHRLGLGRHRQSFRRPDGGCFPPSSSRRRSPSRAPAAGTWASPR
jgi:hypothetical protein